MSASLGGISASVDMRGAWVGVRDQGARSSCLACAASDVHRLAHELDHPLSAEYLFFHGAQRMPGQDFAAGLTFEAADAALRQDGQPNEAAWPYEAKDPNPWTPPVVTERWFGGLESMSADVFAVFGSLKAGIPVLLGVRLVAGFNRVQKQPHIVDPTGRPAGGHAVLAVGIGRRPAAMDDDLIMIRNSWGFAWGSGGHAWLPLEYLADKLVGYRSLTALQHP